MTFIEVKTEVKLDYDRNSADFIQTLNDFKASIYKGATERIMIEHVAWYGVKFGFDRLIEGVGYVRIGINGERREPYSGITLISDDFEMIAEMTK